MQTHALRVGGSLALASSNNAFYIYLRFVYKHSYICINDFYFVYNLFAYQSKCESVHDVTFFAHLKRVSYCLFFWQTRLLPRRRSICICHRNISSCCDKNGPRGIDNVYYAQNKLWRDYLSYISMVASPRHSHVPLSSWANLFRPLRANALKICI